MSKSDFVVGPETVRMLELGHPWILSDKYTRKWPQVPPGTLVQLADEAGKSLGSALVDPKDRVVARMLGGKVAKLDAAWFEGRLRAALLLRERHAKLEGTSAYRLVNAEGDGLPGLTVDRYGDYLMVQFYSDIWKPHQKPLMAALARLLSPAGIYLKGRPQDTRSLDAENKKYARLVFGQEAPEPLRVQENGLDFQVRLEEGLNTGLFLDQRNNRRDLMERCRGMRVLNLFCYTGAFSVAAAAGGAKAVTSVDASQPYLDWAKENFAANRLNPKTHEFILGDCFAVLKDLKVRKRQFDLVLMDPPSFSTVGKSRFTTRGGTSELVAAALDLLPEGGLLITCSNHQKVDVADYLKELRRGALAAGSELRVLDLKGQPEDFPYPVSFPEGRYLKYVIAAKG